MCVIAFAPKGVDIPTREELKKMWDTNPDGAGYAYVNKHGKVVYKKGFMTFEELMDDLKVPERFKSTNFAIHFRIGTSGKNDGATCHPFPLSTDFGELRKTEGETDSVLFHNGVLSEGGIVSPLSSDTQDFVVAMTPLLSKYTHSKTRDYFIGKMITGNRLLVIYKNNRFKMFGDWKKDGDLWVSNLNYKDDYKWYGCGYYDYHDYNSASDYMGAYYDRYTVRTEKHTEPAMSKSAEKIWKEVIQKEYKIVTKEELDLLKDSADGWDANTIELDGYVLGYSEMNGTVWIEYSPYEYDYDEGVLDDDEELELDKTLNYNKGE